MSLLKTKKNIQFDEKIYQISTLVAGDFDISEVLDRLAAEAVNVTGTDACSIRLLDDEDDDLKMCSSYGLSERYQAKGVVSKNDPVIKAAFEGEAIVIDDMRTESMVKYRKEAVDEGLVSQLTVVMKFKKRPIGVLRLYRKKLAPFDEADIKVARLVASQCCIAIMNARLLGEAIDMAKMSEQMKFAGTIQRRMIPQQAPKISGLDVFGMYQPCFDVGGDLYDYIQIDEKSMLVVIADVIGKGLPAALMMSMFRGAIRAYSHGGLKRHSLDEIVTELNHAACSECRDGEFITLFIAYINTENCTITYCNCGHEPALLFRGEETIELDKGGLVLGILPETDYVTSTVKLQEKDSLLFYTDGLTDAANFDGDTWGKDNMVNVAKMFNKYSSEALVNNLIAYRRRFVGLARQNDDTSVVAVKVCNNE